MKIKYLVFAAVIYYACFLFQGLLILKDSAVYLLLARSLASGNGYFDYFTPLKTAHTHFPPGYPVILSLAQRAFGANILLFRALNIILCAFSLLILGRLFAKFLDKKETFFAFLIFALNPCLLQFAHTINSEAACLLFSLWGILLLADGRGSLSIGRVSWAALLIITAFFMRSIGITLYLALLIYLLIRRKYQQSFIVMLLGLSIIPWGWYSLSKSGGYGQVFMQKDVYDASMGLIKIADIPARFFSNLRYYAGKITADLLFFPYFREVTFGNLFFPLKIALSLLFSLLFLGGFYAFIRLRARIAGGRPDDASVRPAKSAPPAPWGAVKKGMGVPEIYCILYLTAFLFWPYHEERFLLPIFPFLIIYLFIGLRGQRLKFLSRCVILALLAGLLAGNFKSVKILARGKDFSGSPFLETVHWLKENTSSQALIMSNDPAGVYFYSQRKGLPLDLRANPAEFLATLKEKNVDYLVMGKSDGLTIRGRKAKSFDRYVMPLLDNYPHSLKPAYQTKGAAGIIVYRINDKNLPSP